MEAGRDHCLGVPSHNYRGEAVTASAKEYKIESLGVIYDNGSTHKLTVINPQGSFISPDRRYPQERVLFVGTEAECRDEQAEKEVKP